MAADGTDLDLVKKVPQLHLARIWRDGTTLYGAKVVNTTLGNLSNVCGRLVDAALEDAATAANGGQDVQAKSTLYGLSDWVRKAISQPVEIDDLASLEEAELSAVEEIAKNGSEGADNSAQLVWERLAQDYVKKGLGGEASLYQSKGGVLSEILLQADTTPYSSSSGGAMASFKFSSS